jgi:3-hydroxyisobutyrate dehydrogenase
MTRVGFIGLGNMGSGMAANLAAKGFDVAAFDLSAEALDRARAAGCGVAASAADAAASARVVVTMLPAGAHVATVWREALFPTAAPGTLLVDCSTIDVETARTLAAEAAGHGLLSVDAPVSGGIAAAAAGTLTFMVGGSEAAFLAARPVLEAMGQAVVHAGPSGSGQAAKICNNMLLAASMVATSEAFVLAEKLGLDPKAFYDIASRSSGQCWSMTRYCPVPGVGPESPADREYQGGFATALMLKDLKLAMDAAAASGAQTPMGARAAELYAAFAEAGHAGLDFSAIILSLR